MEINKFNPQRLIRSDLISTMGLYPPLETGDNHRLQHVAEVRFHLEKERDFRVPIYKKYRREANVADVIVNTFTVATLGEELLAIGMQAGAITCGLLGAGGNFIGRRIRSKARKHNQIRSLSEVKLNTVVDRISIALTDDKISEEEFPPDPVKFVGVRNRACLKMKKRS